MNVNPFVDNAVRVFPPQNRYEMMRYDMNENSEGLRKEFVGSVLKHMRLGW